MSRGFRSKMKKNWVVPYQNIVAIGDGGEMVELVEQTNCVGGALWARYHYTSTSPLIISSKVLGSSVRYLLRAGETKLKLVPVFSAAGIEKASIDGDKIHVTYAGLGGGGVGATVCRALAKDVMDYTITDAGGSRMSRGAITLPLRKRVLIGVDDTDTKDEGATWALVHNIASSLDCKNSRYLSHAIVQLFPVTYKTQNCVSTVVEFGCIDEARLIKKFRGLLEKRTLSENTGMVSLVRFDANMLADFAAACRREEVEMEHTLGTAKKSGARIELDGRGVIGALAAIPYFAKPEEGVKVG